MWWSVAFGIQPCSPELWFVDGDGDGSGDVDAPFVVSSCDPAPASAAKKPGDCDDADASVPAPAEACNGRDDDCDGSVDEGACGCEMVERSGHVYRFCDEELTWDDAESECANDGYHLVTIDDAA